MISMLYTSGNGARRRVNATPIGTFSVKRAVRPLSPAWRVYGTLLGLITLASSHFVFQVATMFSRGARSSNAFNKGLALTQPSPGYIQLAAATPSNALP